MNKGKFIVLEGIDGSGKSTQCELLCAKLAEKYSVHKTFQPTKDEIGSLLRKYLIGEYEADNLVLATLFASDRLNHLLKKDGLLERYNRSEIIVCDRNYFSSFAYQGTEDDFVIEINRKAREILKPDLHIFIDVDVKTALKRINENRDSTEIFENEQKLTSVYNNYIKYFKKLENEENIIFIDGNRSLEEISNEIFQKVSDFIK